MVGQSIHRLGVILEILCRKSDRKFPSTSCRRDFRMLPNLVVTFGAHPTKRGVEENNVGKGPRVLARHLSCGWGLGSAWWVALVLGIIQFLAGAATGAVVRSTTLFG